MNVKNDIIANDESCITSGLQKVLYNHHDVLQILYFHKFHKVDVLSLPFLSHYLIYNVLLFSLYFFLGIVCHIFFVFQEFLFYDLISILSLFFLIMVYCFCDIPFFHYDDILDFVDIGFFGNLPNILYNKGLVVFGVLFCILDKFSYENNNTNLLFTQEDISICPG